jgi:hypothetical protein
MLWSMLCLQEEICSPDPWIILHKIDSPTKMRYIGSKVASCNASADSYGVAPSIAPWVKPKGGRPSLFWLLLPPRALHGRMHALTRDVCMHICADGVCLCRRRE